MASYLRPRRGQKSTAETQAIVLKKGEVFFEIGNSGTPTTGSNAVAFGKIKMGDGSTTYSNLGYFIDVDTTAVAWDNTGYTSATSASQGSDLYGNLNAITPSATLKSILGNVKALLYKLSTQVTQLNNDFGPNTGYSAAFLNSFFSNAGPRDLGTITSANVDAFIAAHIKNGRFYDIRLGDVVTIQDGTYNHKWIVAGFNTELGKYTGSAYLSTPHISLVPYQGALLSAPMNSSNVTTNGFKGSAMYTSTLETVITKLTSALSTHLLTKGNLISNATASVASSGYAGWTGTSSGWEWVSKKASLLTEAQIYGAPVFSSSGHDTGEGYEQLPIFRFMSYIQVFGNVGLWLRGVADSAYFCAAGDGGDACYYGAGNSRGVAPLIIIG